MRRSSPLLALLLLVPLAACGGDDDEAAQDEIDARSERDQGSEDGEGSESEERSDDEGSASGDGTSADDYADGVCSSIGGWYEEIESASKGLVSEAETLSEDPGAGKQVVLDFLDDAIALTDTLVTDLEDVGVPDTDTGPATADKLVGGIEDVRELFQQARDDTDALPADDPAALGTGLQDIGSALQESATAVGANFEEVLASVDDAELATAFEGAQSCTDLATAG